MDSELTVGQRLRIARKAAGLTQDELGESIGVGKSQISNLEKGASVLTRSNAIVLSERIGIPLNWLMTGEGETPKPGQLFAQSISSDNKIRGKGNEVSNSNQAGGADLQSEVEQLRFENALLKAANEKLEKDKENLMALLMKK